MTPAAVISKKRDGGRLSKEEISFFIDGFTQGKISDGQMAALSMAIFFQSMTDEETAYLTEAMLRSGAILQRTSSSLPRVGKHSTGGLGDKTSLVLAPLLACCDLLIPKLSGRGLGITGGTLDKLESIPGYRTNLSEVEISKQLDAIGCVITGATESIVPADRKLYELRDVTGTVPSIPLITSSIMSKKLAESLDALVLDVKYGSGAFMATREQAEKLAASLVGTGRNMGVATEAVLSDMNQPLGEMVGNACEVNEAMAVLRGEGPLGVADLVIELCSHLLLMTKSVPSLGDAKKVLGEKLKGGYAYEKFMKMVSAQGGMLTDAGLETASPVAVKAFHSGRIVAIDGQRLGEAVIQLGGGRRFKGEKIDHSVGLKMHARIDDQVLEGETLLEILAPADRANTVVPFLQHAFTIVS